MTLVRLRQLHQAWSDEADEFGTTFIPDEVIDALPALLDIAEAAAALADGAVGFGKDGEHRISILGARWAALREVLQRLDGKQT